MNMYLGVEVDDHEDDVTLKGRFFLTNDRSGTISFEGVVTMPFRTYSTLDLDSQGDWSADRNYVNYDSAQSLTRIFNRTMRTPDALSLRIARLEAALGFHPLGDHS